MVRFGISLGADDNLMGGLKSRILILDLMQALHILAFPFFETQNPSYSSARLG